MMLKILPPWPFSWLDFTPLREFGSCIFLQIDADAPATLSKGGEGDAEDSAMPGDLEDDDGNEDARGRGTLEDTASEDDGEGVEDGAEADEDDGEDDDEMNDEGRADRAASGSEEEGGSGGEQEVRQNSR